jgi:hypothetical protein
MQKKRKKRVAPSLHGATSHWLHANSIPNIGCHYFWPGLIALPKNTLPIMMSNYGVFIGPWPWDYHIGSNFRKFYLIRTNFTLSELVSLVKVFRLFRLEQIFLVLRVWTE